ncbi:hypothetical protein KEM52_004934 [Ascosphaera acerosa]|nr:hypothetical protein KEM52_004934 [Ascosphaera acerosa]
MFRRAVLATSFSSSRSAPAAALARSQLARPAVPLLSGRTRPCAPSAITVTAPAVARRGYHEKDK